MVRWGPMLLVLAMGLLCGFVGSIPIAGPTAVLVLERGLNHRSREAFEIAVGAAVAEGGYALLAFLGMTAALGRFPWMLPVSRVLGAVILLGLGLYLGLSRRAHTAVAAREAPRRGGQVLLGLLVTGINPTLLATWSAVVPVLHAAVRMRVAPLDALPFALGVTLGILGWFGTMLALIHRFRSRVHESTMDRVVQVIGWVLVAGAGAVIVNLIWRA